MANVMLKILDNFSSVVVPAETIIIIIVSGSSVPVFKV